MKGRLGITGATGYIGRELVERARANGWTVVAIGRRAISGDCEFRFADLTQPLSPSLVESLHGVIHLAAHTHGQGQFSESECRFARDLSIRCRELGVPLVVTSSQAASENAPSAYGRTKAAIEREVRPFDAIVVRPGLVVGGRESGLFGLLVKLVRRSWVLPRLLPAPSVQPVHVGDLADALLIAVERKDLAGQSFAVAGPPMPLEAFLLEIAHYRLRQHRLSIPLPGAVLRFFLKVGGLALGPSLSPERFDSLMGLPHLESRGDLAELGVALRPLSHSLTRSGSPRSALLLEGAQLTRAVMAEAPTLGLLRRYVRLMNRLGHGQALELPMPLWGKPLHLAAFASPALRPVAAPGSLAWRMELIGRLAEAEPKWAHLYIPRLGHSGLLGTIGDFSRACWRELWVRVAAICVRRSVDKDAV